jgi:O-antigen/teichoic acid export membrane protein
MPFAAAWREAAWILIGQAVGAVGAIVGVRVLTGLLTPDAYGEFALGLTAATLVMQIVTGPLANAFERFYAPAQESGRTYAFLRAMRHLTVRASLVVVLLGLLVGLVLVLGGRSDLALFTSAAVGFAVLSGWEGILDGVQNAARQRKVVAFHQGLRQWLRPLAAGGLISVVSPVGWVAMSGYAIGSLATLGSQTWLFRRIAGSGAPHTDEAETRALRQQMLGYAQPFATWGIFSWMQMSSDRWALQFFGATNDVGLYAVLAQLGAYPLNLVGGMLVQLAAPFVFARAGAGVDRGRLRSASLLCVWLALTMLGVTTVLAALAHVGHSLLFALVAAPEYRSVSTLLPLTIVSSGLFGVGQMLSLIPMAAGDSRALLAPKISTALLALAMNAAGAYLFGLVGVLWAGVLFALTYTAFLGLLVRRQFSQTNG